MESELHIPPLFIRRQYLAFKDILKSRSWSYNNCLITISELSSFSHHRYWSNKKKPLLATTFDEVGQLQINSADILKMFSLDTWRSAIQIKMVMKTDLECIKQQKQYYNPNVLVHEVISE